MLITRLIDYFHTNFTSPLQKYEYLKFNYCHLQNVILTQTPLIGWLVDVWRHFQMGYITASLIQDLKVKVKSTNQSVYYSDKPINWKLAAHCRTDSSSEATVSSIINFISSCCFNATRINDRYSSPWSQMHSTRNRAINQWQVWYGILEFNVSFDTV